MPCWTLKIKNTTLKLWKLYGFNYINVTVHILYQVNFDLTQFDCQFPLTASLSKQGNQESTLNKKFNLEQILPVGYTQTYILMLPVI